MTSQMSLFTTRQTHNHRENRFPEISISIIQKQFSCYGCCLCSEQPIGKITSSDKTQEGPLDLGPWVPTTQLEHSSRGEQENPENESLRTSINLQQLLL